jgi:hypothetical protein
MIHLECGSGWCAAQDTPDPDCRDAGSPACSSNPAESGPKGSRRPPSLPCFLPLGSGAASQGAPRRPANPTTLRARR